jgi:hypothetical protein
MHMQIIDWTRMRIVVAATAVAASMALAGCGASESTPKAEKASSWTVSSVEGEYNDQLNQELESGTSVSTSCILESGKEGGQGKLLCHLEYSNGDGSTVEIVVPADGNWIAHPV